MDVMPLHLPSLLFVSIFHHCFHLLSFTSISLHFPFSHPQPTQMTGLIGNIHGNQPWKNNKCCSQNLFTRALLNRISIFFFKVPGIPSLSTTSCFLTREHNEICWSFQKQISKEGFHSYCIGRCLI